MVSVASSAESRRPEARAPPPPERRERLTPAALRRNPGLRKELRPALEHALAEKLEDLGLRPVRWRSKPTCVCLLFSVIEHDVFYPMRAAVNEGCGSFMGRGGLGGQWELSLLD